MYIKWVSCTKIKWIYTSHFTTTDTHLSSGDPTFILYADSVLSVILATTLDVDVLLLIWQEREEGTKTNIGLLKSSNIHRESLARSLIHLPFLAASLLGIFPQVWIAIFRQNPTFTQKTGCVYIKHDPLTVSLEEWRLCYVAIKTILPSLS